MEKLSKDEIIEILQISHERGLRCGLSGMLLASTRSLLSNKKSSLKVLINPKQLLSLLYSNRSAFAFCYYHPFLFIPLSEFIPLYTNLSPVASDLVAGLISGLAVFLDTPKQQQFVGNWSLTKSFEALCVYLYQQNIIRLPFGSRLFYSAFVAHLYYSLIYTPLNLPLNRLKSVLTRVPVDNLDNLIAQNKELKFNPILLEVLYRCRNNSNESNLCSFSHSRKVTCLSNSLKLGYKYTRKNMAYFLLISLLPVLLFNRKKLVKSPYGTLSKKLFGVSRTLSLIFITASSLSLVTCKSNAINNTKTDSYQKLKTFIKAFSISFITSFLVKERKLSYFNFILGPLALTSIINKLKIGGYLGEFRLMWPIGYIVGFTTLLLFSRHKPKVLNSMDRSALNYYFLKSRILS